MKEHTNKLAFNYQTLQEAAKHSAAAEQANGGKVECELFQGQELATWSYLEICYYKQQGQCVCGGEGKNPVCLNLRANEIYLYSSVLNLYRVNLSTRTNLTHRDFLLKF